MWGQIIGAAAGLYSAHRNKRNQEKSIARNEQREDNKIQRTVDQAKAAGIHPLAALGASPSYSSPAVMDTTGNALGDGLANVIKAKKGEKRSTLNDLLIKSQIDESTSRTQLALAQADRIRHPQDEIDTINTYVKFCNRKGECWIGPNPEAFETSHNEMLTGAAAHAAAKALYDSGIGTQRNDIIDRGFKALTGRDLKKNYKDKTNYSTSKKSKIKRTKLKAYPTQPYQKF